MSSPQSSPTRPTTTQLAPAGPGLGATATDAGVDFAVYAPDSTQVYVCLFDHRGVERREPMAEQAGGIWSAHVPQVGVGQRYGYRAEGPWLPDEGLRFNSAKLLVDPYARAVQGEVTWRPEVFGGSATPDERDSAPYVPRSVVVDDTFDWGADAAPRTPWDRTVVYETHVRGLTENLTEVPAPLRGTYAGVAHPATIRHLTDLGVTAVELLPVHTFTSEPHLAQVGLENYWGYNTLGYFAPHAAYASTPDPAQALAEFKGMVKLLHEAGLEVILDVVYNHTSEQSAANGATLSWRGLAARDYYRLDHDGVDIDVTGCGNTFDLSNPRTRQLVLDSLRYWVQEMHVDGFRFDLAPALARGEDGGFEADHPFLTALHNDPVLSAVKLIAEPWDVGPDGWRTGQFPLPFADWNDHFRDTVRTFWLGDLVADQNDESGRGVSDLATRIAGSPDLFGTRSPMASLNVVTTHDGFPALDLATYDSKHNEANLEDNRDGSDNNRSWNFGTEGPSESLAPIRRRAVRNLLATLLLSSGVPMLLGGDEFGRTQGGNNNAYCQDNEISWYDWNLDDAQRDMVATTSFLTRFRSEHPVLRPSTFFPAGPLDGDGLPALLWFDADGHPMTQDTWNDGRTRTLQAVLDGRDIGDDVLLLVLHGGAHDRTVNLPALPGTEPWRQVWDSAWERPAESTGESDAESADLTAGSVQVFVSSS